MVSYNPLHTLLPESLAQPAIRSMDFDEQHYDREAAPHPERPVP